MIYLAAGLLCLFTVAFAAGRPGLVAAGLALTAAAYAFLVYDWRIPIAATAGAAVAAYLIARFLRQRRQWLPLLFLAGAMMSAFAVLGPDEGLF